MTMNDKNTRSTNAGQNAKGVDRNTLLIKSIMNSLRGKSGSDSGEGGNNSDTNGGGSNSDNSALVSIGNSIGFNYDVEEGMSSNSKEGQNDSNDDSDGVAQGATELGSSCIKKKKSSLSPIASDEAVLLLSDNNQQSSEIQNDDAANAAVASLKSIVSSYASSAQSNSQPEPKIKIEATIEKIEEENRAMKRRPLSERSVDVESDGYNTDDDDGDLDDNPSVARSTSKSKGRSKKKRIDENKREERNQREKERSLRISKQITELRALLASGGVVVPKGTKSSVLTEAATYIRMLQQHQYRSEIDRHQLVQQMQMIGGGAHGPLAAEAIRHVAAQNGVWSLGNFGGVPPKSAMTFYDPSGTNASEATQQQEISQSQDTSHPFNYTKPIDLSEYRYVFNSCGAGMAIASMGGAFLDCNQLFCQLSNYTKQEVCSLTIFNLTARQDLQLAFDQISQLISPPMDDKATRDRPKPVVFRGAMKNRNDLGLNVSLVKGDDGVAKCFCVTLVKNPESPFDTSKPVPVSFDAVSSAPKEGNISTTPAFTSG